MAISVEKPSLDKCFIKFVFCDSTAVPFVSPADGKIIIN